MNAATRGKFSVISALTSAIMHSTIDEVPEYLIRVVDEGLWQEFTTPLGQDVHHDTFESFVTTPPTAGLGTSMATLRRICTGNTPALDALDRAVQRPAHKHADVPNSNVRPTGTTADQALRRLRKDSPDLHADVLAGRLSAHAAMVQAGYRPRTCTVRLDDPRRAARTLLRNADPDFLDALRAELEVKP